MTLIQEGLLELKEKLKDPKKVDKKSKDSKNSVNREERKERSIELGMNLEEEEERSKHGLGGCKCQILKVWTRKGGFQGLRNFLKCRRWLLRTG